MFHLINSSRALISTFTYDVRHPLWHKCPDWFLVVGVPHLYEEEDLRASYVIWQEGVAPFVVVELLSPGTQKEDLGPYAEELESTPSLTSTAAIAPTENGQSQKESPPKKWVVYEQIIRVPYYIVFSRYTGQLRFFQQVGGHYQEQTLNPINPRLWIPELELGLGVWEGKYAGISHRWLRWCDAEGDWIPTAEERVEQEQQRAEREQQWAEREQQRAERLAERLRQMGIDPDEV